MINKQAIIKDALVKKKKLKKKASKKKTKKKSARKKAGKRLDGRPVKYKKPEDMQVLIDQYFDDCRKNRYQIDLTEDEVRVTDDFHPTITGLGLVLDLTREGLIHYGKKGKFADTIKRAKSRVEAYNEQALHGSTVTGVIFNLKNNFGWKDKIETEHSGSMELTKVERTIVSPSNTDG